MKQLHHDAVADFVPTTIGYASQEMYAPPVRGICFIDFLQLWNITEAEAVSLIGNNHINFLLVPLNSYRYLFLRIRTVAVKYRILDRLIQYQPEIEFRNILGKALLL